MPSSRSRTAAVVLAGFCAFLTIYAPQPLLPMLAQDFHASAAIISLVVDFFVLTLEFHPPVRAGG